MDQISVLIGRYPRELLTLSTHEHRRKAIYKVRRRTLVRN